MPRIPLRHQIAAEAARLLLRGKEKDYTAARKRAVRWLSRRRVSADDMPSNAEIQVQLYALGGLFVEEREIQTLLRMRDAARELMEILSAFQPRLIGSAVSGPVTTGAEVTLQVVADSAEDVMRTLNESGRRARLVPFNETDTADGTPRPAPAVIPVIRWREEFPFEVQVRSQPPEQHGLTFDEVRQIGSAEPDDDSEPDLGEDEYHPDAFALMQLLLARLESVQLDPQRHPEGDALYHSLQVYELGLAERPYDEEFLLACLLHDVGLAINRRLPVTAAIEALGDLITDRTRFLIEHRAEAVEYLKTGRLPRSLRRSEHFEDLVLLARCDLAGRVRGASVGTAEEALDYIAGLSTAWDDV